MANEHSFDVSTSVDIMEIKNAIEISKKEILSRYDFKGIVAKIDLNEKDKTITLLTSSDSKIDAMKDILISKIIKRGITSNALKDGKKESVSGSNVRLTIHINDTIDQENAKKITKTIKESKLKVNATIRGDEIRVIGKSIDDLQECIRLVRSLNLELPISFKNLK